MSRLLTSRSDRPAATRDELERFRRYRREHDPADLEALVERFLPLARALARRYDGNGDPEDLVQVASLGLLKAVERFDPDRGIAFSTFATPTILGELRRYFRDFGWSVRVPRDVQELALRIDHVTEDLTGELGRSPTPVELAERAGTTLERVLEALASTTAHRAVSLDQPRADDGETTLSSLRDTADPGFERVEDAVLLGDLLQVLSPRERAILRLRFRDELTQQQIGRRIGVSQMQVSRLIRQAVVALQREAQGWNREPAG